MKKRILHLITGLEVGGAETMLLRILPLLERYFDNQVCCIKGRGPIGKLLEAKGIKVHYLDLSLLSFPFLPLRFFKVVREVQPYFLTTYLIHADIFGRVLGYLFSIPKIISNRRGFYLNRRSLHWLDRFTSQLADAYIVQTSYAQHFLSQDFHVPPAKIFIVPNPINLEEFQFDMNNEEKRQQLVISAKSIVITCVANLKPGKGLQELINAYEMIFPAFPQTELLLIGDGPLRKLLQENIKTFQSKEHISFLGRRKDVREILRISNIFVLPTHSEGMSNAILEAMASSLPIITTDIPVNLEIITDGENGCFVPVNNTPLLAQRLQTMLDNPEKRHLYGKNARRTIEEKFEIHRILDRIRDVYIRIEEKE